MKIFYAVQATGNGHIARAQELLPYLERYGKVDVFLSGGNSSLDMSKKLPIRFRSKGISLFYNSNGGLNYWNTIRHLSPIKAYREAKDLPVEKYDIVINDFESITSLACRLKNIPSVNFGHQASFMSDKTPRPDKKDFLGELVLKKYAPAQQYVGLHFEQYDHFILSPVIKKGILNASPKDDGHVTVYLPHYSDLVIAKKLKPIKDVHFHVFSKRVKSNEVNKNITFMPVDNESFVNSMIHSTGIITGAGFETPAESLFLGKKLMVLPIKGQYEQLCNAAALKHFDVPVVDTLDDYFPGYVKNWLLDPSCKKLTLSQSTPMIVAKVIQTALSQKKESGFEQSFPDLQSLNYNVWQL